MKIIQNADLDERTLKGMSEDDIYWVYNGLDVCLTKEIHDALDESIDEVAAHTWRFSQSLMPPIFSMTLRGVKIDKAAREVALSQLKTEHEKVEHNLRRIVEQGIGFAPFNYRSYPQVGVLMYKVLSLKPVMKRSGDRYSPTTDRDALEKLSEYYHAQLICAHIIYLRELDKKINFLETPLDEDGRMRTSYNIAGTNTGRLSSKASDFGTGTNQQNIERALRRMFVADDGMKFCNIDLEQADSRNVGARIWDTFVEKEGEDYAGAYLNACESGDLHTSVCRMAWRNLDWPDDRGLWRSIADRIYYREFSYRDMAKRLGHGTNFYGTPRTMALHTKTPFKIIQAFQEAYFAAFPAIGSADHNERDHNWHNSIRAQLEQFGYITTTHFRRRRHFFGRPSDGETLRAAIAYEPQSMTADEIDSAILRLFAWGRVQLLIQVHDSILFQYPEELEDEIVPQAVDLCITRMQLKRGREFYVPAEAKVGWNWADRDSTNEAGLVKWKGHDDRVRPEPADIVSWKGFLHG